MSSILPPCWCLKRTQVALPKESKAMKIEIIYFDSNELTGRFETPFPNCAADFVAFMVKDWYDIVSGTDQAVVLIDGKKVAVLSGSFPAHGYIPLVLAHMKKEYPDTPIGESVRMEPEERTVVEKILQTFNEALLKKDKASPRMVRKHKVI